MKKKKKRWFYPPNPLKNALKLRDEDSIFVPNALGGTKIALIEDQRFARSSRRPCLEEQELNVFDKSELEHSVLLLDEVEVVEREALGAGIVDIDDDLRDIETESNVQDSFMSAVSEPADEELVPA